MEESNYYEILNIASTASFEEIRAAYKRQCKIFHPDVNKSIDATRQMQLVNEAYRVLHNQYLRAQYDKTISYYNSSAKASSYCENDECQESDDSFDPMRNWSERTEGCYEWSSQNSGTDLDWSSIIIIGFVTNVIFQIIKFLFSI